MNLMKNQIIQNSQSLEILKEKGFKEKTHFFNHFTKQLCSMGPKCLALSGGHMCKK
jgi:hypothetical protein